MTADCITIHYRTVVFTDASAKVSKLSAFGGLQAGTPIRSPGVAPRNGPENPSGARDQKKARTEARLCLHFITRRNVNWLSAEESCWQEQQYPPPLLFLPPPWKSPGGSQPVPRYG